MFPRLIKLPESQSFFLFGPRGAGKSTLLKQRFSENTSHTINLLLPKEEDRFLRDPHQLEGEIAALSPQIKTLIIDEVQKAPKLLDLIHHYIENPSRPLQFILTGSSARKLKKGRANLLAGRAITKHLHPLTFLELKDSFNLENCLCWGSLPKIFSLNSEEEKKEYLQTYALTYLKEEIQSEQIVRRLEPFRRFLEVAAQSDGKIINYSNIARDTGTDAKTVKSYYEVLEDTLIGFYLEAFHTSRRKRLRQAPKFFFFDVGVSRALSRQLTMIPATGTSYYGDLFERFIILELFKNESYQNKEYRFTYLQTQDGTEIDVVVERPGKALALIEIKSSSLIREETLSSLHRFEKDFPQAEFFCFSQDKTPKKFGKISCLFWKEGLERL